MSIQFIDSAKLPTKWAEFTIHGFTQQQSNKEHIAITLGDWQAKDTLLVRVHSECLTGDALFSQRCDCGAQLEAAMQTIAETGQGIILYLRQEGRGIGLINKIRAYHLQDDGADTVEANKQLGFSVDAREYDIAADILRHLKVNSIKLMTNNPQKVAEMQNLGIQVVQRIPWVHGKNHHNSAYLLTKAEKLGHLFESDD